MQTSHSSQAELPAALEQAGVTNPGRAVVLLRPQDTNNQKSFKKWVCFGYSESNPAGIEAAEPEMGSRSITELVTGSFILKTRVTEYPEGEGTHRNRPPLRGDPGVCTPRQLRG